MSNRTNRELRAMGLDFDPYDPWGSHVDSKWVDPTRTDEKWTHPYSYSEFYIFGRSVKGDGADYSDRLWQWNYEKADRLWKEHVGCRWDQASAAQLSAFMSAYHGRPLRVTALAEGCNIGNGYPYWIVWYRDAAPATSLSSAKQSEPRK